jgi:hypothetical protein
MRVTLSEHHRAVDAVEFLLIWAAMVALLAAIELGSLLFLDALR